MSFCKLLKGMLACGKLGSWVIDWGSIDVGSFNGSGKSDGGFYSSLIALCVLRL
jgi:hypothetical protein